MLTAHRSARLGKNEQKLSLQEVLYLALHPLPLSLEVPPTGLSSRLRLWANQYWDLLPVVIRCNSPGSCCPGELWWGCCWGWMTGRAPPWCRGPRRFLKNEKQGREDVWALRRLQPGSSSGSCEITEVVLERRSLPLSHDTQGSWTLNSALSRSSMVTWERSNKCVSSSEKTQS